MNRFLFNELPGSIQVDAKPFFDDSCEVFLSDASINALESGRLKILIEKHGNTNRISRFRAEISAVSGQLRIAAGNDDATVKFAEGSAGNYNLKLWRNSAVTIGAKTTSNGVRIVCDNSSFTCGEDCMFSDEILIQTADQHGIVDLINKKIVNDFFKKVELGNHVWIGRQVTLTSRASVGHGSVIGTASVVTGRIPDHVIAVGAPARVLRENHTWCRSPIALDDYARKAIENTMTKSDLPERK